uniref:Selenoprotein F/M domain-containing protein n=1 Tax=Strombidium inclinatum TaxID=197538 RepID=A0A7S3IJ41_9SPIT|mmetsp:Transcript_19344/g.29654  ORF Transcript_19344/g.29654 Transcript_19344/m.29654 type:complete len:168 (+) Transcript_19344:39-542(+)|eukprot:CAMPEP_0170491206 /NCGR_PEP_ID=MMETSP0208-20121228/10595_1 /TAXON_ID=197538 /ORGANISM="Strombidium inclinatum, Strain S3" /LENGTH=167 /DNA_ID=CAMNT_0010766745 /DNA_START=8 /DNA_END=511 /DNA_ORIENTATION=-
MLRNTLTAAIFALVSAADEKPAPKQSYLDNIEDIENFKFDHVMFKTKKDCALDNYPSIRQFLEVESAHYAKLDVRVASEGQARVDLFNEGKKVDTIHIYKWDIEEIRLLMADLGLERDESNTWEKRQKAADLDSYLHTPPPAKKEASKEDKAEATDAAAEEGVKTEL